MRHRHGIWMLTGCVLPLMLIFVLPLLGIRGPLVTFFALLALFACHAVMLAGFGHGGKSRGQNEPESADEDRGADPDSYQH